MPRKAFEVTVELDIQAVTCPGVWLCPTGKVTLRVCMLGSTAKTLKKSPVFPLLYHEKFIFRKTICSARFLTDLQRVFSKECLYAELVQWQGGDYGTVLATFESSLEELLYPSPSERGLIAGVDIDLLMEPASCFPGILSPKIEVSTKTTIEEVVNPTECDNNFIGIINPKLLSSKASCPAPNRRQRKVCHSRPRRYHRRLRGRPCRNRHLHEVRPPFVVRHVEDDLSMEACSPVRRCRRSRCRNCSTGSPPRPVWRSESDPRERTTPPCPPAPAWTSVPRDPVTTGCHCCKNLPGAARSRSLSPSPYRRPPSPPPPQRQYESSAAASAPARLPPAATRCKCSSSHNKDGACQMCDGYKKYFDVCDFCRYPIIPTKRHPQGCLCNPQVTARPKTVHHECRCSVKSDGQEQKHQGSSESQHYGENEPHQCSKYPFLSCNEYPCGRRCTQCLLDPRLGGEPVERRTARPRHVEKPSYREAFYHTLEKFYKKLYKRAKSRASEETSRRYPC